ncbi:MAG TPA: response regulator [Allocoleopsis sp.]
MNPAQVAMMTTKTILLIHSEYTVREVLQACLSQLGGWNVHAVGSPSEGLQRSIQEQPDAIVFDLSTSGMTFFTFLKQLSTQPATQHIPVVLISNGAKWLKIEHFPEFQVAGLIDYSLDPIKLPQQIATLLNWDEVQQLPRMNDSRS